MAKKRKINSVPPTMPIDWRAWQSSPRTQSMTDNQVGIAFKIMLKQWELGSVPRSAWDLARDIKSNYRTTLKFLQTYSNFAVCMQCGRSWSAAACQCGVSDSEARLQSVKLKNFNNDVNSGTDLGTTEGTTEPNLTKPKPNRTDTDLMSAPSVPNSQPAAGQASDQTRTKAKPNSVAQAILGDDPDATPLTKEFLGLVGRKFAGNERDLCNIAFEKLLAMEPEAHILDVMRYAMENEAYGTGIKMVRRSTPWDYFCEKFSDIAYSMQIDDEKKTKRAKKFTDAKKENLPDYRKNPTGREFLKPQNPWDEEK